MSEWESKVAAKRRKKGGKKSWRRKLEFSSSARSWRGKELKYEIIVNRNNFLISNPLVMTTTSFQAFSRGKWQFFTLVEMKIRLLCVRDGSRPAKLIRWITELHRSSSRRVVIHVSAFDILDNYKSCHDTLENLHTFARWWLSFLSARFQIFPVILHIYKKAASLQRSHQRASLIIDTLFLARFQLTTLIRDAFSSRAKMQSTAMRHSQRSRKKNLLNLTT